MENINDPTHNYIPLRGAKHKMTFLNEHKVEMDTHLSGLISNHIIFGARG